MGIFRRGIFRVSNSCEISHIIFKPLCEIDPLRNHLEKRLSDQAQARASYTTPFLGVIRVAYSKA